MTLHPILRVAIAAAGAAYVAPKIANAVQLPELDDSGSLVDRFAPQINFATRIGSVGITAAGIYTALGMVLGGRAASPAGGGGAS